MRNISSIDLAYSLPPQIIGFYKFDYIYSITGALYDAVGFSWSTMFTVGWNAAVCVITIMCLLGERIHQLRQREYTSLEDGSFKYPTDGKETDRLLDEVQANLTYTDGYQSL